MNARDIQGLGISALSRFAQSQLADTLKLRKPVEKLLYRGSKAGFQLVSASARLFKPSAGKGKQRLSHTSNNGLFDLSLSDEQQMMRDSLQRFAADTVRPHAHDADAAARCPEALRLQAQELGLALYAVPEALGGVASESTVVTQLLAAEDLAHGDFSLAAALLAPMSVANALTRWGSELQQATYLPAFAEDTPPLATIAVTEPTVLFDPSRLSTKARRDKSGFVLNGEKSLVIGGASAELLLIAAELDGQPQVFIVPAGTEGLRFQEDPAMGMKAAETVKLQLDNVMLPVEALLGEGELDYQAFIDFGYLAWCALATGTAQAVLDYVVPYVNEREAFGEPISHRQGVAFMVADMAIEVEAMRIMTWRAGSLAEAGKPFHREIYLARLLCAEKAMQIGTNGVQLLGGHGFTKEHPVERWYRDLRAVAIAHGGLHL